MAHYQAKSTNGLCFEVRKDSEIIGKLSYNSWFKLNAVIAIADATFTVEPKGFWETTHEIRHSEKVLLTFNMGWKGEIVLRTHIISGGEDGYIFKHLGLFRESFTLVNREGIELLVVTPHLKWAKINYEYEVKTTDIFETLPNKTILLLTALHCGNYYLSMTMATISM